MRYLIVGNWKMNGLRSDLASAQAIAVLAAAHSAVDVALCVPATLIALYASACVPMPIGAQDCHPAASGAFTGHISAPMLADAGAQLTLVGHSERRAGADYGTVESSALVLAKAHAALDAGLSVIICVGEPRAVRDAGNAVVYVLQQLAESLGNLGNDVTTITLLVDRMAVAYEPIWAIGTGLVASVADVAEMHDAIRHALVAQYGAAGEVIRLLYGGSVSADNAQDLLSIGNVDGALVGGASLKPESFGCIIAAADVLANSGISD